MTSFKEFADALSLVEDASLADTKQTFYRNGKRGHLHSRKSCWKVDDWNAASVTLSLQEALVLQGCDSCFLDGLPSADLLRQARELFRLGRLLRRDAEDLGSTPDASVIGRAIDSACTARVAAERLSAVEPLYTAAVKVVAECDQVMAATQSLLGQDRARLELDVARDLHLVLRGRGKKSQIGVDGVPFLSQEQADRLGASRPVAGSDVHSRIWLAWHGVRSAGEAPAAARAMEVLNESVHLRDMSQLVGVSLDPDSQSRSALEAVAEAWRAVVTADVRMLVQQWEQELQSNLADTAPRTLALSKRYAYRFSDAVSAVLRGYDVVENDEVLMGTYPSFVALWGMAQLKDDVWLLDESLSLSELHTCLALWDPSARGEFRDVRTAAAAAVRL